MEVFVIREKVEKLTNGGRGINEFVTRIAAFTTQELALKHCALKLLEVIEKFTPENIDRIQGEWSMLQEDIKEHCKNQWWESALDAWDDFWSGHEPRGYEWDVTCGLPVHSFAPADIVYVSL